MNTKLFCFLAALLLGFIHQVNAQEMKKVPRIGFLSQAPIARATLEAFLKGLHDLGYVDGKSIIIEYRDAKGTPGRLPTLASELVGQKFDVIVVVGGEATLAAKNASNTIPIVMTVASDPVRSGLVAFGPTRWKYYGSKRVWAGGECQTVGTSQRGRPRFFSAGHSRIHGESSLHVAEERG